MELNFISERKIVAPNATFFYLRKVFNGQSKYQLCASFHMMVITLITAEITLFTVRMLLPDELRPTQMTSASQVYPSSRGPVSDKASFGGNGGCKFM